MSTPMAPSWYDVLGVEPAAPAEEIRTAWRDGIADLDPGDRRFRLLSQAAEVLLDADRRQEYDAELAAQQPEPEPEPVSSADEEPVVVDPSADIEPKEPTSGRRGVPGWVLSVIGVLVVAMVAAAAYLATQPSDSAIADNTRDAQSAAERAMTTVLAYDYRHLDADQKAAEALMTPSYQKQYDKLFAVIKDNAPQVKPIVTVSVIASGIIRSGDDRVQVLVFVNRPISRVDGQQVSHDQVRVTMEKSGSDWLVDDLQTEATAS